MKHLRSDAGFSLSELIVALGLFGVLLSITWFAFGVTANGSRQSDRESRVSKDIGWPLLEAERLVMQRHYTWLGTNATAGRNLSAGDYLMAFDVDRDGDDNTETYIIEAVGHDLIFSHNEAVDQPAFTSFVWSRDNYNREAGVPLFEYYSVEGDRLTDPAEIATRARTVVITIVAEYDGRRSSDSRTVLLRNQ